MDSKMEKLDCLTLGEWKNDPISKKKWSIPLSISSVYLCFWQDLLKRRAFMCSIYGVWDVNSCVILASNLFFLCFIQSHVTDVQKPHSICKCNPITEQALMKVIEW